jgi:hypothetical protein
LTATAERLLDDVGGFLSPDERRGVFIPVVDVGLDMTNEAAHGIERAAAERSSSEDSKPRFDQIEPGAALWREMKVHAQMVSQPLPPHAFWNDSRWFPEAMEQAIAFFRRTLR